VKATRNGPQPDVLLAVKFATGSCAWIDVFAIQHDIAKNSFKKAFPDCGIQAVFKGPGKGRI
jgi:hypothetical protein